MSDKCNRGLGDFYFSGLLKWQTWDEHEYFWIGPGRFGKDGKSSIKAVWIDKLEISRVTR